MTKDLTPPYMTPPYKGRVIGTCELVVHANYIVIIEENATTITVLNVIHAREKYP
jgi:plasmid stabilization system protein ParE